MGTSPLLGRRTRSPGSRCPAWSRSSVGTSHWPCRPTRWPPTPWLAQGPGDDRAAGGVADRPRRCTGCRIGPAADLTVAPNEIAAGQARGWGAERTSVCHPLVAPEFRPASSRAERTGCARRSGCPPGPLALVVSGSWGVGEVEQTAADIAASGHAVPVVVCGRNDALRARLSAAGRPYVLGLGRQHGRADPGVRRRGAERGRPERVRGAGLPRAGADLPLPARPRAPNATALDADGTVPWIRSPDELARRWSRHWRPVRARWAARCSRAG